MRIRYADSTPTFADAQLLKMRRTALCAVKAAGRIQLENFGRRLDIDREWDHDLKLAIDRRCEQIVAQIIRQSFPEHQLLTEEGGVLCSGSEYIWIVDPLDGSVNYFHQIPYYSVSLACYRIEKAIQDKDGCEIGEPLLGMIYQPACGTLYEGISGWGALYNDMPIAVASVDRLQNAIVSMSFGSTPDTIRTMSAFAARLAPCVSKIRVFGSTSVDLVNVACGRTSGHVQGCVAFWDFAAARIILEESGGIFEARRQKTGGWEIIGCAPQIHADLKRLLDSPANR